MMSLLNNWDLKQVNNAIYVVDGEHHYAVSDAGATFGNTGNAMTRSKGVPKDYEGSKFIAKDTPEFVDFVLHSRPFFLAVFSASRYEERARMEKITQAHPARRREVAGPAAVDADRRPDPRRVPRRGVRRRGRRDPHQDLPQADRRARGVVIPAHGAPTVDRRCGEAPVVRLIIEPADGVAPLLAAIKRAKTSVEIAIFRLDRKDVEMALTAAAARGVRVTALIAFANRGGEKRLRQLELRLLGAGIIVARTSDDLVRYHGKYILIDRRVLYVLSFNFTHLDIDRSRGFGDRHQPADQRQ